MKALNGYATYTDSDGVKRYKGPGPPPFTFAGLGVIVSPHVCERRQYRFPRSRRRRILKKWSRRDCNFRVYDDKAYVVGSQMVMSPGMRHRLDAEVRKTEARKTEAGTEPVPSAEISAEMEYRLMDTPFMRYLYRESAPGTAKWYTWKDCEGKNEGNVRR